MSCAHLVRDRQQVLMKMFKHRLLVYWHFINLTGLTEEHAGLPSARLDYIFLRRGAEFDWDLIDASVIFDDPLNLTGELQWRSDHMGVYAELEIHHH